MHPSPLSLTLWRPFTVAAAQRFLSRGKANQESSWLTGLNLIPLVSDSRLFILSLLSSLTSQNLVRVPCASACKRIPLESCGLTLCKCSFVGGDLAISSSVEFHLCFLLWTCAILILVAYIVLEETGSSRRAGSLGSFTCWSAGIKNSTIKLLFALLGPGSWKYMSPLPFTRRRVAFCTLSNLASWLQWHLKISKYVIN